MADTDDNNLALIEEKLRLIASLSQQIEGSYDVVNDINFVIISALRALRKHGRKHQPEEFPSAPTGVVLAA
jgi:hypothetical protein